jgi:hypothetical protein
VKCCEACGEVLVARASGRLNPKRRFCDQRCINRAKKMAELADRPTRKHAQQYCLYCGETLQHIEGKRSKQYCSTRCYQAAFRMGGLGDIPAHKIERIFALAKARLQQQRRLAQASQ